MIPSMRAINKDRRLRKKNISANGDLVPNGLGSRIIKNPTNVKIKPQRAKTIAVIASLLTLTLTGFEESNVFVNVALQNRHS